MRKQISLFQDSYKPNKDSLSTKKDVESTNMDGSLMQIAISLINTVARGSTVTSLRMVIFNVYITTTVKGLTSKMS